VKFGATYRPCGAKKRKIGLSKKNTGRNGATRRLAGKMDLEFAEKGAFVCLYEHSARGEFCPLFVGLTDTH